MLISINQQVRLVVFSMASGLIIGILFDWYRLIRGFKSPNKVITFIEDTLFWILSSIIIFIFLLYTNYAYIGMYVYLFIIIGITIYIKLMSNFFIVSQHKIILCVIKTFRVIKNIIVYPFQIFLYKIIKK